MRNFLICAILALPSLAVAQPAPEMVLLPKALADAAMTLIARDPAVQIHDALLACVASNAAHPPARDDCPSVTAALKAQAEKPKP